MARSRTSRSILQALLGFLLLAWLPTMGDLAADSPFLLQAEGALSLSEQADPGEPDGSGRTDREGGLDALVPSPDSGSLNALGNSKNIKRVLGDRQPTEFLFARHATGPPGLRC